MDYMKAKRLRDTLEAVTLEETVLGDSLVHLDSERVEQRYVIGLVMARDAFDINSDYLVLLPTGCGTPGCWGEVPPAGQIVMTRKKVRQLVAA